MHRVSLLRLAERRAVTRWGLLLTLVGTVGVVAVLLSLLLGLQSRSAFSAVRETVTDGPASALSEVVGADVADDSTHQNEVVRRALVASFAPAPVVIRHSVVSNAWPLAGNANESIVLLPNGPEVEARIQVTAGSLNDLGATGAVAIDAEGARALHLGLGSRFAISTDSSDEALRVVAIWQAQDPGGLGWVGAAPGTSGSAGRLIAGPTTIAASASNLSAQWAVAPSTSLVPADLASLVDGYTHLRSTVSKATSSEDVTVSGDGGTTAADMNASHRAAGPLLPVPLALMGIAALVALVLLNRLLAAARGDETRLLRARGASLAQLTIAGAVESAAVGLVGSVLGSAAAEVILATTSGPARSGLDLLIAPLVVFLGSTTVGAAIAFVQAATEGGGDRAETGRARTAASVSLTALAVLAAGLTSWRLISFGAPGTTAAPDPIGTFAPAALLCALALLAVLALGPVSRVLARTAGRIPGLTPALPARQVARRVSVVATPVALLTLAIGGITFTSTYSASWNALVSSASHVVTGADVRVAVPTAATVNDPTDLLDPALYRSLPGVTQASLVQDGDAQVGSLDATVIGVDSDHLTGLVSADPRALDIGALRAAVRPAVEPGIPIASSETTLRLEVDASRTGGSAADPTVGTTAWIADSAGSVAPLTLTTVAAARTTGADQEASAPLPAGGPWRLVALDVAVTSSTPLSSFDYRVVSVGGGAVPAGPWQFQPDAFGGAVPGASLAASGLHLTTRGLDDIDPDTGLTSTAQLRLMPTGSSRVPVAISQALASATGARVGSTFSATGQWASFGARVTAILPTVPGTAARYAVFADLRSLTLGQLRVSQNLPSTNQLWLAARSPGDLTGIGHAAAGVAGPTATVTLASGALVTRFLSSAVIGVGLGAAGAAGFAVVALIAALAALARERAPEIGILRALGVTAARQARDRGLELGGMILFAVVAGLVSGALVTALAVTTLTRLSVATAPQALPVPLHVDGVLLGVGVGGVILACILVSVAAGSRVAHLATRLAPAGDDR